MKTDRPESARKTTQVHNEFSDIFYRHWMLQIHLFTKDQRQYKSVLGVPKMHGICTPGTLQRRIRKSSGTTNNHTIRG